MKPKISVIVPIYNTKKYLDKCLQSIINQTMQEIEIICIDDFSPDDSYLIVEKYIAQDSRVSLIRHEKSKGSGGARNTGILAAKADFLAGVDSDDYIKPEMMQTLWDASENGTFDIVCCGYSSVNESGKILNSKTFFPRVIHNGNNSIDIYSIMNPAFWNKLWRKSLFVENRIFFPKKLYYQDLATIPRILFQSKMINIIDGSFYNYLVRKDSVTTTHSSKHITDHFEVFSILLEDLKRANLETHYRKEFLGMVNSSIKNHSINALKSGMTNSDIDEYLRHFLIYRNIFLEENSLPVLVNIDDFLKNIKEKYTLSNLAGEKKLSEFQIVFSKLFGVVFSSFINPRQRYKLKNNPGLFFKDSKNGFTRFLGFILRII